MTESERGDEGRVALLELTERTSAVGVQNGGGVNMKDSGAWVICEEGADGVLQLFECGLGGEGTLFKRAQNTALQMVAIARHFQLEPPPREDAGDPVKGPSTIKKRSYCQEVRSAAPPLLAEMKDHWRSEVFAGSARWTWRSNQLRSGEMQSAWLQSMVRCKRWLGSEGPRGRREKVVGAASSFILLRFFTAQLRRGRLGGRRGLV